MKSLLFLFSTLLLGFTGYNPSKLSTLSVKNEVDFELTYITIGFGQNKYHMQPAFRVRGIRFVYTYEDMWRMPDRKLQCDTLLVGDFRISSIDSISNLINEIKDTVIHKSNIHFIGGAEREIEVSTAQKKISFQLLNTTDTSASKIITILNSYMSGEKEKQQSAKYWE
jgi:hypothetical protein